jgi:hypothetical protein
MKIIRYGKPLRQLGSASKGNRERRPPGDLSGGFFWSNPVYREGITVLKGQSKAVDG